MTDPRTDLYNVLSRRLTEEMVARDEVWADYWQRRRVVVVPDGRGAQMSQSMQDTPEYLALSKARNEELNQKIDAVLRSTQPDRLSTMQAGVVEVVVRDCIARLKAAREKDAVNKNLSTLLAVVVKVQHDLEALLNGSKA